MNDLLKTKPFQGIYRLPYSKNDNPNGWIEITTHCNMKCPGCYRGCHLEELEKNHETLEKIKQEIDLLVEIRNCQIISISGGEPLLHPNILEIVEYISKKGLTPLLHTNGKLLDEKMLINLKKAGLISVFIRIDSLMQLKKEKTEQELNEVRGKFALMVNRVNGINLGFICVVSFENIKEVPDVIHWFRKDQSNGDFLTLIPIKDVLFNEEQNEKERKFVALEDLHIEIAKSIPDIAYTSYLGSQLQNKSLRWLQTSWIIAGDNVITNLSGKSVEFFQVYTHFNKGKYSYLVKNGPNFISLLQIVGLSIFLKDFRRAIGKMVRLLIKSPMAAFRKKRIQVLSITIPPEVYNGNVDLCDACPDAILFNGDLVPSCGLEEIKKYGSMLTSR